MSESQLYFLKASARLDLASRHLKNLSHIVSGLNKESPIPNETFLKKLDSTLADAIRSGQIVAPELPSATADFGLTPLTQKGSYPEQVRDGLLRFRSVGGKIRFDRYRDLLNHEDNLYKDKIGHYNLVPGYSRRILPDMLASALAILLQDELVAKDIRPILEQHLIAMMNNYDYVACAHVDQVKEFLGKGVGSLKTYYAVVGAAPAIIDEDEYRCLINERIRSAVKFERDFKKVIPTSFFDIVGVREGFVDAMVAEDLKKGKARTVKALPGYASMQNSTGARKLTEASVRWIFDRIEDNFSEDQTTNPDDSYNVVLFTSTFHIARLAMEVERRYFDADQRPANTIIVGDANYFAMFADAANGGDEAARMLALKKTKSSLFDLYMHASDKNGG